MRSFVQVLTTPTADTPGTTLLLHFDNKRYLIGGLSEGTQRACVQMGARLLKVSECFITGRIEWRNTGGLIGMILTLADAAASSAAASAEEAKKRAQAKGKRLGLLQDEDQMKELEEEARKETNGKLTLFSAPNMNHMLATARRFVFRKGMPVDVHEIEESKGKLEGDEEWAPYWADDNIKAWTMSVLPSSSVEAGDAESVPQEVKMEGTVSPRKRSIDEVYERHAKPQANGTPAANAIAEDLTPHERDQLIVKAVVGEMFNSTWRLDTLYETPLNQVKLPATIFIRNPATNKLERYTGPLPNQPLKAGQRPLENPSMTVLVRKPWPGALVESLPRTQPRKEAVSYIIRNHTQRGRFHPERATQLKVEKGPKWSQLSSGQSVQNTDGETITPEMVLGESKAGGGIAVVDLPEPEYIGPLLTRPEWKAEKVMAGVGAVVWICGPGVASDTRLRGFIEELKDVQHVISSPELCANNIALDSAAAATVRLRQVDPKRYTVPIHQNESASTIELPKYARVARRGQTIQLEPKLEVQDKPAVPLLNVGETEAETSKDVLALAAQAQQSISTARDATQKWTSTLPEVAAEAEIVTLGTGSALPSKYRNVSATLLRVPGWGSMLFDCGENTLGQLKRVFTAAELKEVLRELRLIFISHMHADHHLGTVSVIKAWYEDVHGSQPLPEGTDAKATFDTKTGLALVSEPAMLNWLSEFSSIEDYGFSRLAPLFISAANTVRRTSSELCWFIPPPKLAALPSGEARMERLAANNVPASLLNLRDIQAVTVQHCHGARAASLTFPSGFKASYSGDCRPSKAFSQIGWGSTVCIHEATFDDDLFGDAQAKNHSTTSEALGVAQAMGARTCVLTHFSQRYQKLPVLEHGAGGGQKDASKQVRTAETSEAEDDESTNPEDNMAGPLENISATFPDQTPSVSAGQTFELPSKKAHGYVNGLARTKSAPEAVKFSLASDMKVCVAFDYMRVKIGEIPELEKFTPALLKLFEEEDRTGAEGGSIGGGGDAMDDVKTSGKKPGKNGKGKARNQRGTT